MFNVSPNKYLGGDPMEIFKIALDTGFLLFILGVYWNDIAGYIQKKVATCNPKIFGFLLATFAFVIIYFYVS